MTQLTSEEFNRAMLSSSLPAKLYKIVLAYYSVGGWKSGTPAFLAFKDMTDWGITRKTLYRHTDELVRLGWFVPAGKSKAGFHQFLVQVPPVGHVVLPKSVSTTDKAVHDVGQVDPTIGQVDPHVGQVVLSHETSCPIDVITDITTEEIREETKSKKAVPPVAIAPVVPALPLDQESKVDGRSEAETIPNTPITNNDLPLPLDLNVSVRSEAEGTSTNDPRINEGGTPSNGGVILDKDELMNKMNKLEDALSFERNNDWTEDFDAAGWDLVDSHAYRIFEQHPSRSIAEIISRAKTDATKAQREARNLARKAQDVLVGAAA